MSTEPSSLSDGRRLHQEGQLSQAKLLYQQLLARDPDNAECQHLLGLLHAQLGDYPAAVHCLEHAIAVKPCEALYHTTLANSYKALNRHLEAKAAYQTALVLQPDYAEAHNNLGTLYHQQGDYAAALTHYQAALRAKPHYVEAHRNLGLLFLHEGDHTSAATQFRNVLELKEDDWQSHYQLGNLSLHAEDWNNARVYYRKALDVHPNHIPTLNNLGVTYIKLNDDRRALDYFTQVLILEPNHLEAANNSAALFMKRSRFENAIPHYQNILDHAPHDKEALYNLSVAFMNLGDYAKAIQHNTRLISHYPEYSDAHANLAAIYFQQHQTHQALEHVNKALSLDPNNPILQHMHDALRGESATGHIPTEYVTNLFDQYALRYNQHLQQTLQYHLPQALHDFFVEQVTPAPRSLRSLDLGCGTGLCGQAFASLANTLVGIDLSENMIQQARQLMLYNELIVGDITHVIPLTPEHYDLVLAGEVFEYFGALDTLLLTCAAYLTEGGHLLFSIESANDGTYTLQPSARFAHSLTYIRSALQTAGFTLVATQRAVARQQEGKPFHVLMVLATKG